MMNFDTIAGSEALLFPTRKAGPHAPPFLHELFQCLGVAAVAMASYLFISHFVLESVAVVGSSMAPTLCDSQHYLLNRWIYCFHAPSRKEIVVLRDPADNGLSVKRIIATAGDSVYFKDGGLYVNGRRLQEPYLAAGTVTLSNSNFRNELIVCGRGRCFVLGDNRENSIDSRSYGPVPIENILGFVIR